MIQNHLKMKSEYLMTMKSVLYLIILFVLLTFSITAQINQLEFVKRVKASYYSLQATAIKNYSLWITSDHFKENSKVIFHDNEVYPLELIWINPDRLFFIKNALPEIKDTTDYHNVNQLILDLSQELKGIFVDWQRFLGTNLLFNLPENYLFTIHNDTVNLEFQIKENQDLMNIIIYFGVNGLCLKIITENLNTNEILYTYPKFDYVDNKWLCSQWRVQIISNNQVTGGFLVNIVSEKIIDYYLPVKLRLLVQSKDKEEKIYMRNYFFKNIMVNRDLKIIGQQ